MTEKNIVLKVAKNTGYPPEEVLDIFTDIFKVISDGVMKDRSVQIRNFGTFNLKCLGRRVINYHYITGEPAVATEHYKINFVAFADLRRRAQRKRQRDINKQLKKEQMEMERVMQEELEKEAAK